MKFNQIFRGNRNWNKRGFIFTLDIIMGIVILFIFLGTSLFLVTRASEVSLSQQQILETGSDITAVLDREQVLASLDSSQITTQMANLLPPNYGMLLRIEGNFSTGNGI